MGITALAAKIGRHPSVFYTDREGGLVSIIDKNKWLVYSTGMTHGPIAIKFCAALGSNHRQHGLIEARVSSLKGVIGKLTMDRKMTAVQLNIFLISFMDMLKDIP